MKGLLKHLLWSQIFISGGLFTFITFLILVDYIPNQSRIPKWLQQNDLSFFEKLELTLGFLIPFAIFHLTFLALIFLLLKAVSESLTPKWKKPFLTISAGFLFPFTLLLAVIGLGYYVALDGYTGLFAVIMGLIYGTFIFPKLVIADSIKNKN